MFGCILGATILLLGSIRDAIFSQEDKETITSCIDLLSQYLPDTDKEG